jgi:hypothetical protein
MMEHRLGRRVPVRIPVGLRLSNRAQTTGTALDLGRGGMFVRTAAEAPANCCLDVLMRLPETEGEAVVRVPAMVIHRSKTGLGLMFRELDSRSAAVVAQLMLDAQQRGSYGRLVAAGFAGNSSGRAAVADAFDTLLRGQQ